MSKFFYIIFFLILGCSLNPNSAFWSKSTKIKTDKKITKILFEDQKPNEEEFNPKLIISLPKEKIKNINFNFNNDGFSEEKVSFENLSLIHI